MNIAIYKSYINALNLNINSEESQNIFKALTTNYLEGLIQKYILDNTHASLLTLKPEKGLAHKEENELKEKLENYKNSLSEEELNNIVEETKNLILRQSTPDSPELLETIPLLSLSDIGTEVEDLPINKIKHNDIEILQLPFLYHLN